METQKVKANGCLLRKMENGDQHAPFIYILRLNKLVGVNQFAFCCWYKHSDYKQTGQGLQQRQQLTQLPFSQSMVHHPRLA